MLSLIVAAALNNAIGKNNQLLWHLPADLKHFKNLTSGHTIIMGRKTFESIGKPLPNRRNLVITRSVVQFDGAETASSVQAAIGLCADEEEIFIIGGGEIYREALPLADKIYFTWVEISPEADTFFPGLDENIWVKTASEHHAPDEKNHLPYTFITYEKTGPK